MNKKEADDQKKNIEELQSLVKKQNLKLATAEEALNELEKTVESQKRALEESVVGVDSQRDADVGGVQARYHDTGGAVLIAGRSIRAGRSEEGDRSQERKDFGERKNFKM